MNQQLNCSQFKFPQREFSRSEMIAIPCGLREMMIDEDENEDEEESSQEEYNYNSDSGMDSEIVSYLQPGLRGSHDDFTGETGRERTSDKALPYEAGRQGVEKKNSFYGRGVALPSARKLPIPRLSTADITKASKVDITFGKEPVKNVKSVSKYVEHPNSDYEEERYNKEYSRIYANDEVSEKPPPLEKRACRSKKCSMNSNSSTAVNPCVRPQPRQLSDKARGLQGSIATSNRKAGAASAGVVGAQTKHTPSSKKKRIFTGCSTKEPREKTEMQKMKEAVIRASRIAVETYRRPIGDVLSKDDDPADYPRVPQSVMSSRHPVREYFTRMGL